MSVIEEVIHGLESLRTNPSSTVVDMLVKIHEQGLQGPMSTDQTLRMLTNSVLKKSAREQNPNGLSDEREDTDPFPSFLTEKKIPENVATKSLPVSADRDSITQLLEQVLGSYQELLSNYNQDFNDIHARRVKGEQESNDEVLDRLREVQLVLLKYPIAGQALYASLIRQGREYAKTDKGQELKSELENSAVVAKARTLFEGVTGGMLAEQNSELPSTYIDGFLEALDRDLEQVLSEVGGVDKAL